MTLNTLKRASGKQGLIHALAGFLLPSPMTVQAREFSVPVVRQLLKGSLSPMNSCGAVQGAPVCANHSRLHLVTVLISLFFVGLPSFLCAGGRDGDATLQQPQTSPFHLFAPYDSSKLDPGSFLPAPLGFLEPEDAWFGIDCAFATFRKAEGARVPDDIQTVIGHPVRADARWKDGQAFRNITYTEFLPTPVPDEITLGMSKETLTYGAGPECSEDIPDVIRAAWFAATDQPGWYYAIGWGGDFMVLVNAEVTRAMIAFKD